jgi:hypothetical protein
MLITLVTAINSANSGRMVPALSTLAARNLADKRNRQRGTWQAKARAAAYRPATGAIVPAPVAVDVPVTFKAERPQRKRVTRSATTSAPAPEAVKVESTPPQEYRPVPAKELPTEIKRATSQHRADGALSTEWFCVGITDMNQLTVHVYARTVGNSVRYAVAA